MAVQIASIQKFNPGYLRTKRIIDVLVTLLVLIPFCIVIRKTSIDELPQFFNGGEMTLVGPRPPLPYEVEHYSAYDQQRLCGKPGLTGPWQVYGRSRVPFQGMVEMDIAYLQRQSLKEDLKLIALTVPVMIQGRGGV